MVWTGDPMSLLAGVRLGLLLVAWGDQRGDRKGGRSWNGYKLKLWRSQNTCLCCQPLLLYAGTSITDLLENLSFFAVALSTWTWLDCCKLWESQLSSADPASLTPSSWWQMLGKRLKYEEWTGGSEGKIQWGKPFLEPQGFTDQERVHHPKAKKFVKSKTS